MSLALLTSAPPVSAQTPHGKSDWSRVHRLVQGAGIVVTVKGAWTAKRYFVSADDDELVVSNDLEQVDQIARADVAEIKNGVGGAFLFGWLYNRAGVI